MSSASCAAFRFEAMWCGFWAEQMLKFQIPNFMTCTTRSADLAPRLLHYRVSGFWAWGPDGPWPAWLLRVAAGFTLISHTPLARVSAAKLTVLGSVFCLV